MCSILILLSQSKGDLLMEESLEIVISEVDPNQVPSLIQEQFSILQEVKKSVDIAIEKADVAQNSAKLANQKSAGLLQKKEAIETLQEAGVNLSDAVISQARAQEVSLKYQQKLAEVTKILLCLGISDIALNRSIVRELELKLSGASQEELDDLERQEILSVVKQLKAQEDIMSKQSQLTKAVKEHEIKIEAGIRKDQEHDAELQRQAKKDTEHDRLFAEKEEKDQAQDTEIAKQAAKDDKHDRLLAAIMKKDRDQDDELARQAEKDDKHDQLLAEIKKINQSQDEKLACQAEWVEQCAQMLNELRAKGNVQKQQITELITIKNQQAQNIEVILAVNNEQAQEIETLKKRYEELQAKLTSECSALQAKQGDSESNLRTAIETKTSKTIGIISILLGSAAFILALVQYII